MMHASRYSCLSISDYTYLEEQLLPVSRIVLASKKEPSNCWRIKYWANGKNIMIHNLQTFQRLIANYWLVM
jgi:hypothetical protein